MVHQATLTLHREVQKITPPPWNKDSTAIGILPGGGHSVRPTRLTEVMWPSYSDIVWVAGTRGDPAYTEEEILGHLTRNGKTPSQVQMQLYARHTPDQAKWLVELLLNRIDVTHFVLSTADYHLVRGALTFLKAWLKAGDQRKLRLSIISTSNPTEQELAVDSATSQTLEEELERIEAYQQKGDVATADEFYEFVRNNH